MNSPDKKTQDWLERRPEYWAEFYQNQFGIPKEEMEAFKSYFFDGELDQLLNRTTNLGISLIASHNPTQDPEVLKQAMTKYWFWVLEDSEGREGLHSEEELNAYFNHMDSGIFFPYINGDAASGVFKWLYGDTYEPKRTVTLSLDGKSTDIVMAPNVNDMVVRFFRGFVEYFWREKPQSYAYAVFENRQYFYSIYSKLHEASFWLEIPRKPRIITEDGQKFSRGLATFNQWLLACMNGYVTKYEEEEGITELKCYRPDDLALFREEFEKIEKHPHYERLLAHVLSHDKSEIYRPKMVRR